jgi:hypothetical protein
MTHASSIRRRRQSPGRKRPERVYVASPVGTYDLPLYGRQVAALHRWPPDATLILARDAFTDTADWLTCWPAIVPRIDALVFFAATDRTIGAGVFQEIADALNQGVPVRFLSRRGTLHPFSAVEFSRLEEPCPRRYVRVSLRPDRRAAR